MNQDRHSESPDTADVVVVGAGVGGLVAAVELAAAGRRVVVVERAGQPGGKLRRLEIAGHAIDAGPTVFTLPDVFAAVFAAAGRDINQELMLEPVEILARHAWADGSRLDLFADAERSVEAIGALAGAAEARRYRRFCADARRAFDLLDAPFMRHPAPGMSTLAASRGPRGMLDLARLNPFATLWTRLGRYFHDPRLRQLFARYATYTGSDPFRATATLMLIAHVEQAGVWRIHGGLYRLAEALERVAGDLGATFVYGCDVTAIEAGERGERGVTLASGQRLAAPNIVCAADARALADGRLGVDAQRAVPASLRETDSLSGATWALRAESSGFELAHHNVFFGSDYAREFADIFERRRAPDDPTVYVCAQDCDGAGRRPGDGPESLLVLANAPPVDAQTQASEVDLTGYRERVFGALAAAGLRLDHDPAAEIATGPADFARLFPGSRGALYGQAAHGWRAPFERPIARSALRGLYLAGGSIHPGAGLPMVALSGRHAAHCLLSDNPW